MLNCSLKTSVALKQICVSKTSMIAGPPAWPDSHQESTVGQGAVYADLSSFAGPCLTFSLRHDKVEGVFDMW